MQNQFSKDIITDMELVLDLVLKTPNVLTTKELPLFNNKWESTNNHENVSLNSTLNFLFCKKYKFQMGEYLKQKTGK